MSSSASNRLNLKALGKDIWSQYRKTATTQTDLVDGFLLYVLATGIFQVRHIGVKRRGDTSIRASSCERHSSWHEEMDAYANEVVLAGWW